jgi:hypothetical protein
MHSMNAICPISARPAYLGPRRIAPAAATSRAKAWGARPAVEELRPARRPSSPPSRIRASVLPRAPFVAHVVAQMEPAPADPRLAARSYIAADGLGYELPQVIVATL